MDGSVDFEESNLLSFAALQTMSLNEFHSVKDNFSYFTFNRAVNLQNKNK